MAKRRGLLYKAANKLDLALMGHHARAANRALKRGNTKRARKHVAKHSRVSLRALRRVF